MFRVKCLEHQGKTDMNAGKKLRLGCFIGMVAAVAAGGEPIYRQMPAKEVNVRDGIGNVMAKIRAGKTVTVAYFGGSITSMNGWRNLTTAWLKATYPQATFKEVDAAIGGTGSDFGVFRLGHDVLRHNPDLLFVEFATNDGSTPGPVWRAMEGIVRQTWKHDPATDIVFAYTITKHTATNEYWRGFCNPAASAMEMLADHYGISSVNFGPRVAGLLKAGKLLMDAKEIAIPVPVQSPDHDKEVLARAHLNGRILFSNDSVHPRPEGHALYLDSVTNAFPQMAAAKPVNHASKLAVPFLADNLEAAKMVPIVPEMLAGKWRQLAGKDKNIFFTNWTDSVWFTETPGSSLTFTFKGREARLYDIIGPDGGQVWVTVDGKKDPVPHPRFDHYCYLPWGYRLTMLYLYDGKEMDAVHTVTIVLDSKQPDRTCVSSFLTAPEKELSQAPFVGTTFWPAAICVDGEIIK